MDRIRIRGGRGLGGTVRVSGSKNGALPVLAATLLIDGPVVLHNVPRLTDVVNLLRILERLGVHHEWRGDNTLVVEARDKTLYQAPYDLVRTMRASFVVLGPLWARRGVAQVSYPGGCVFGHRPVDLHIKGLRDLGGEIEMSNGYVTISGKPRGNVLFLGGSMGTTVLGTANVLMAATLAEGTTYLESAAMEPEIEDLCHFLNACGAKISGIGGHMLTIEGVETLTGCEWSMIPDRIEAGTFLTGAIITNSDVKVEGANPMHLLAVIDRLQAAGARFELGKDYIRNLPTPTGKLKAVDVTTMPYPGFPTDLQAQFMTLMAKAKAIKRELQSNLGMRVVYDDTAAIGKLYRRQDEAGTPFCITVDYDTLGLSRDGSTDLLDTVTVRDRDTMTQERLPIAELEGWLRERLR